MTGTHGHARFDLGEGLAVLERTPGVLRAWLGGLPEPWLSDRDAPGTWTVRQILAHLIHGEETDWIPRARIVLAGGPDPAFQPFDRDGSIAAADGAVTEMLDRFAALRGESLRTLRDWNLTPAQLGLPGRHPHFGPVTLEQLLATWVAHDLSHLAQVGRTMARRYRAAVGPWREYFNTLK